MGMNYFLGHFIVKAFFLIYYVYNVLKFELYTP